MRHLVPLLAALILLGGCATTDGDGSGDARNFFNFGDTGNIQLRSGLPFEVCTTQAEGYIRGHCTILGRPGAMHSDALRHMSDAAHIVWVRLEGQEEWQSVTIPRCNHRRRGPCVAEEFDVMLHEDRFECVTRWDRHPACRTSYYGRGRYR